MPFKYCPNDGRRFTGGETICPLCATPRNTEWPSSRQSRKSGWRKILYIQQDYPDNYVDDSFLEQLQKNVNVRSYDYWTVVYESGVVSQHISSIMIFIAIFRSLNMSTDEAHSAQSLLSISTGLTAIGYMFWDVSIGRIDPNYRNTLLTEQKIFKGAVLFFGTLLGLSPILKTLTKDTSDDTIWAMTVILCLANMLFHDYGSNNRTNITFPASLSTNAAIFASVLLASRLKTNLLVFGFMSLAVEWFALFPIFRRHVKSLTKIGDIALTTLLFGVATAMFFQISRAIAVLYIAGIIFITFICPFWLIWIQRYKNEIHGPWDEAQPLYRTLDAD